MSPFTEDDRTYTFRGPSVAISCQVDYDREREAYVATSAEGFYGVDRHSRHAAALRCFSAWMVGNEQGYKPPDAREDTDA